MAAANITAQELRELLHYDPETGIFTRLTGRCGPRSRDGTGWPNGEGYRFIMLRRRTYALHRLAWLYVHGEWPAGEVDHINGIRSDNRIANLRDGTKAQNQQNRLKACRHSKSGYLGVSWCDHRSKWRAHICVNGKNRSLGRFDTPEAAHAAYVEAKRKLHEGGTL